MSEKEAAEKKDEKTGQERYDALWCAGTKAS